MSDETGMKNSGTTRPWRKPILVTVAHFAAHVSRLGGARNWGTGGRRTHPDGGAAMQVPRSELPGTLNFCASGENEGRGARQRVGARLRSGPKSRKSLRGEKHVGDREST